MEEKDRRCPRGKLHCCNWMEDIPSTGTPYDIIEVQFKNTRKGYYRNSLGLDLVTGDMVAVESNPGHDIGCVTLTGPLVALQMKRAGIRNEAEIRRVFRKAKPADLEKYEEARARENDTMIRSRKIAESLHLNMKIGDVEYQGDGNKAIFYYIADERVDFRQLIKVLAETFKVRIEMKQIGARQEAGRIGGIGSCGRPLCCASWMTNFVSVGTSAARYQDISLNPQKLAGQCAKLKCCLNFEVDTYVESSRHLPEKNIRLETADSTWYHFKTDIFKKEITYSTDKQMAANLVTISAARAFEVIEMNRRGEKPIRLEPEGAEKAKEKPKPIDLASQDDLTRFDKTKKKKKKKKSSQQQAQPATDKAEKATTTDKPATADKPQGGERQRRDRQQRPEHRRDGSGKPRGNQGGAPNGENENKNASPANENSENADKPRQQQQRRDRSQQPRPDRQQRQQQQQEKPQQQSQPAQQPPVSNRGPKAFRDEQPQ